VTADQAYAIAARISESIFTLRKVCTPAPSHSTFHHPGVERRLSVRDAESRSIRGRVCSCGSRRQGEVERRATVAVGPNPSAMRFDDRLADCQAHAAALWFRSKERIKYLLGVGQWQPGACVIYRDLDLAVFAQLRLHRNHAARVRYRLDAIQHQVHEHLLKLHSIRHGHGKIVFEIGADRYSVSSGFVFSIPAISPMTSFIATNSRLGGAFLYSG
jgi:hypothetical protein